MELYSLIPSVWMISFHHWLGRHEEVYYDVKIRGLTPNGEPVGDLEIKESQDNLNLKL